jgi:hypothetical protein
MMLTAVALTGLVLAALAVGHLVREQIESERAYRKAEHIGDRAVKGHS